MPNASEYGLSYTNYGSGTAKRRDFSTKKGGKKRTSKLGGWVNTITTAPQVSRNPSYDDAIIRRSRVSLPTNPANVDGSTDFVNRLQGLGGALLQSIGGQPEDTGTENPYLVPASYGASGDWGGSGIDLKVIGIAAAIGLGIYLVYKA